MTNESIAAHPLVERQLRKLRLDVALRDGSAVEATTLARFVASVSRSYADVDQERYLLERSQDLSSREMAELNAALRVSEARLASLLSLSSDWVWEQDPKGRFTFVSEEVGRSGVEPDQVVGHACSLDGPVRADATDMQTMTIARATSAPFQHCTIEVEALAGGTRFFRISGAPIADGGRDGGYRGVGSDVTEQVMAQRRILELAQFDVLTGLPNRSMFMHELEAALERTRRTQHELALLFVDLDGFKRINDTLGHAAGDRVLLTTAARLREMVRDTDLVARLGGDEFVVILDGPGDRSRLAVIAERIIDAVRQPIECSGNRMDVGASIGIARAPRNGLDATQLLSAADAAMYQAKAKGKSTYEFFTDEMAARASREFVLESELRSAVDREQWALVWQPQIDRLTGRVVAAEALLRWAHPERGILSPADFITVAERTGDIVPIGRWVVRTACKQFAIWRAQGSDLERFAVNLSVRQLDSPSLITDIQHALADHGIAPRELELEITESFVMDDPTRALATLDRLHSLGVQLAVDDFGTGYASLGQLKRIPAQSLKIDRMFVDGLPDSEDDVAITCAVAAMGKSLGMRVTAEGVETVEQQRFLEGIEVDLLQGYLFARPLTVEDFTAQIVQRAGDHLSPV